MGGVQKAIEKFEAVGQNIINNPLPIIETLALVSAGVDPTIAAAAVSAANGGSVQQIATAAAASYAGQTASGEAASAATSAGASAEVVKIAASAAGASTAAVTSSLASGKSLSDALTAGVQAGFVGAGAQAVTQEVQSALQEPVSETGLKATQGEGTQLFAPDQAGGQGLTSATPTTGGQGLFGDPNSILPASLSQYATPPSQIKAGDTGLVPRATSSAESIVPKSMADYSVPETPATKTGPSMTQGLSPGAEKGVYQLANIGLSGLFAPSPKSAASTTITGQSTTPSSSSPEVGSQALAQALRIGDPGAPILGGDKDEKTKASGWNVESLRYMGQES